MEPRHYHDDEISLLALGAIVVRSRRKIFVFSLLGVLIAGLYAWSRPPLYRAEVSFLPQGGETGQSGLASLAGQFGLALPSSSRSLPPAFYEELLTSRVVLESIVFDTVLLPELGGGRVALIDLFEIDATTESERLEAGVAALEAFTETSVDIPTGIVRATVTTDWPSVSAAIAVALVEGVDAFNRTMIRRQAAGEREFLESRRVDALTSLRDAEDRLQRFLGSNRHLSSSPELLFQRDRLEREVALHQQVYTSMSQALEEVRVREARNAPVVTVIEPPVVPSRPIASGGGKLLVLGGLLGGAMGLLLTVVSHAVDRRRLAGDPEATDLFRALDELKRALTNPARWIGRGRARSE